MLYFVDTSALLPRLLRRAPGHSWLNQICDPQSQNLITIAEVTEVEVAAALNQLVRGGALRKKVCDEALALFWRQVDTGEYNVVPVSTGLIRRASELCSFRAVKGYDAIQLTCALVTRDTVRLSDAVSVAHGGSPLGDPIFLTSDNKLSEAAVAEGLVVDSPLNHADA